MDEEFHVESFSAQDIDQDGVMKMMLDQQVRQLYARGWFEPALKRARQLCDLVRRKHGEHDQEYATCLDLIGSIFRALRNYTEAEPLYLQALAIRRGGGPNALHAVPSSLNNLAGLYEDMKNRAAAESLYKEALQIWRETLGETHPEYATGLSNLGLLYRSLGRLAEAEPLYRQAFEIRRASFGEEHASSLKLLDALSEVYWETGNAPATRDVLLRLVKCRRNALGDRHVGYALSLNRLAQLHENDGQLETARTLYREVLDICRATAEDHPGVTAARDSLTRVDQKLGNQGAPPRPSTPACAEAPSVADPGPSEQARHLNDLAQQYQAQGDLEAAERLLRQACEIIRAARGDLHSDFAGALNNLAALLDAKHDYAAAEPLLLRALDILRATPGESRSTLVATLNNLGNGYVGVGKPEAAEPLLRQAVQLAREALGEDHPNFAGILGNLASVCQHLGRHAEAEGLYRQALQRKQKACGDAHPSLVPLLNNLATMYVKRGEHAQAEALAQQALAIFSRHSQENAPELARTLNLMASLQETRRDYRAAVPLRERALAIERQTLGKDHPTVAESLNNLACLHHTLGDYAAAIPLLEQAIQINRKTAGGAHRTHAVNLTNLAGAYQRLGDFARALPLARQASAVFAAAGGGDDLDGALSLGNLASLLTAMDDLGEAEAIHRQALDLTRRTAGADSPEYATCLNNLGNLYIKLGRDDLAGPLLEQGLDLRRRVLGEGHPDYGQSCSNLAVVRRHQGNHEQAATLYQRALEVSRAAFGKEHPYVSLTLSNLATTYIELDRYAEAESLLREAIRIDRRINGTYNPPLADQLRSLAVLCFRSSQFEEVWQLLEQIAFLDDHTLGQIFAVGSEQLRLTHLQRIWEHVSLFLSYVLCYRADSAEVVRQAIEGCRTASRSGTAEERASHERAAAHLRSAGREAVRAAADLILQRKALGADALAVQRDAILGGRYPALRPRIDELASLRRTVAQKALAGPGPEGPAVHEQQLRDGDIRRKRLEEELAQQIPEMNIERKCRGVDARSLTRALPASSALVEFVRIRSTFSRGEQEDRYLAFVLPAGEPNGIQMIDLGRTAPIDRLIADFRAALVGDGVRAAAVPVSPKPALVDQRRGFWSWLRWVIRRPARDAGGDRNIQRVAAVPRQAVAALDVGARLCRLLFDPLRPALVGRTRLFLALDGELTRLPFEVLPAGDGTRLIDSYQISYVATGRDVLRFGTAPTREPAPPAIVADPDFDLSATRPSTPPERSPARKRSRDLGTADLRFERLPGTRAEGKLIAQLLGVRPWLGAAVLESQVKALRSPRILHLATHGFFLHNQEPQPGEPRRLSEVNVENPLLRSGLALAGVNTWLRQGTAPPEAEDGLLTAEDVCGMDLLDTDLVVLSACETGLGEVRTGEGVFGLQRAFTLAGAKTLVMSLWSVPDEPTRELMEDFYRRILSGEGRAEALRNAQRQLRQQYPDPSFWGAFICQGDPGPLPGSERSTGPRTPTA